MEQIEKQGFVRLMGRGSDGAWIYYTAVPPFAAEPEQPMILAV
jgi:hypothetical protein